MENKFYTELSRRLGAIGRALILRRLTPKVERLCKAAEAAGDNRPVTPIPINIPLKPIMNR